MPKKIVNSHNKIIIQKARVNNLKNISLDIPRDKIVVITGLSGSGKSSLAFDTIYAEGNRRYMEGLSSYIRNFLDPGTKPDIDKIENLSPSIAIDQKSISRNARSTVGTLTEVYDYLRILFAKVGLAHCPKCQKVMSRKNNREILEKIITFSNRTQIAFLAQIKNKGGETKDILRHIKQIGYARVRMHEKIMTVSEAILKVTSFEKTSVAVVIDRIIINHKELDKERILDSIETAMKMGEGSMTLLIDNKEELTYNRDLFCSKCDINIKEITPRHFSFNSPEGACPKCTGLGIKPKIDPDLIIPNKNLSLAEGAIRPWGKSGGKLNNKSTQFIELKKTARKHKFSIHKPIKSIPKNKLKIILYGTPCVSEAILQGFQGVIPQLEKKYQEARSDYIKKEIEKYMLMEVCSSCQGKRLKEAFLSVTVNDHSIDNLVNMSVADLQKFIQNYKEWNESEQKQKIIKSLVHEILERLKSLNGVGLEYLTMARRAETISGGEAQRVRLAVQIKSELMGVIYVLDEPSIGLHNRDTEKLIKTIQKLKEAGNSLIIVEHDETIIKSADWIIDMGPGAGEEGGEIIFEGTFPQLLKSNNVTAQYISGQKEVSALPNNSKITKNKKEKFIEITGAEENNLKNIDVKIPLEKLSVICGVSGSGKSTLVNDILSKALSKHFFRAKSIPGKHKKIKGLENINKVITINQEPIGRTPRSNVATYTGVFTHVRDLFALSQEAESQNLSPSHFSFNMKGGRCEVCQGEGFRKIEMHLLPDMYVKCEACAGTRFNQKILSIEYQGKNIAEILDMSVNYALSFFNKNPLIAEKLKIMKNVGLGYLKLGQSAPNLSGGEAQRIKLATELSRKSTGKTLYILDEPTIGLHFDDVKKLMKVLRSLVDKKNTVLVVEHNLDVVKSADWILELGPEGGDGGGEIIFEGQIQDLKKKKTWTGKYL